MHKDAFLELAAHTLHYRVDDDMAGGAKPWLLFCNSLGTDLHMWDKQVAALLPRFRILRYDQRGHGKSGTPPPPYSLAHLGDDVVALLNALEIERAHFCGLSIGGLVGQWLGVHAASRLSKLVLCATAAKIGSVESWNARIDAVRANGLASMTGATAERWFTPEFNAAHNVAVERVLATFAATDPVGYEGCCAALAGADLSEDIRRIPNPVLAIAGRDDPVCPPDDLRCIADNVRNGRHFVMPGRHIVNIESAQAFNAVLLDFLASA